MKYFVSDDLWDVEGYWEQLRMLEGRLSKRAFAFFSEHSFHDAALESIQVLNTAANGRRKINPTKVEAILKDCNGYTYQIIWDQVISIKFAYDGRNLKYTGTDGNEYYYAQDRWGLGDWGYDELTAKDEKYLSHEIQMHSGAAIEIIFTRLDYKRLRRWWE